MPRCRFLAISLNLHWYNTSKVTPQQQQRQERNAADGFWTVAEFVYLLMQNFQHYYRCGKFLSVDEMRIFFKGRQCSGLPFAATCVPYLYETTAWMDCEPVRVLGTFAPTSSYCFRGQRSATGASQLVKVPRPTVSAAYNQGVGGTGQIDQLVH